MNANLSVVQLIFLKQLIDIQTIEKMKSNKPFGEISGLWTFKRTSTKILTADIMTSEERYTELSNSKIDLTHYHKKKLYIFTVIP